METTPVNDRYEDNRDISLLARDQYLRDLEWTKITDPLLSEEEERLVHRLVQVRRDPGNAHMRMLARKACDRLSEAYQSWIYNIAAKMVPLGRRSGLEALDLVQEGSIALVHWLRTYDFTPITSLNMFRSCLVKVVRFAMIDAIYEHGGVVRVPRSFHRRLKVYRGAQQALVQELGREPSVEEVACRLEMSVEDVHVLLAHRSLLAVRSVEQECSFGDTEEDADRVEFVNLFACEVQQEEGHRAARSEMVRQMVARTLPARQRDVIRLRYGIEEDSSQKTHKEIASLIGASEHASESLEYEAKQKLRRSLEPLVISKQGVEVLRAQCQDYYGLEEVAALFGVSTETISQYVKRGRLTAYSGVLIGCRVRRMAFLKSEIDALVSEQPGQGIEVFCAQRQEYYGAEEVAALFGVAIGTISRYVNQGRLTAYSGVLIGCRVRRMAFLKSEIDALVSEQAVVISRGQAS
jgi:RNA polymerase primary sigma factor